MIHLGISLGTSQVVIASAEEGILLQKPSVVAVNRNNRMVACGREAYDMLGRAPGSLRVVQPIRGGIVTEFDLAAKMLRRYIRQICSYRLFKPLAAVAVPSHLTEVEQRSIAQAAQDVNLRGVTLVHKAMAAAVGAGLDIASPHGCLMVDIGAGTADAAVLSMQGVVTGGSRRTGGDAIDESIVRYMRGKYNVIIGPLTAEQVKKKVGTALPRAQDVTVQVPGRDAQTGLPVRRTVGGNELVGTVGEVLQQVADVVLHVLENTPPELAADIYAGGVCFSGGQAQLPGLIEYFERLLGIPCRLAPHPEQCTAIGVAALLAGDRSRSGHGTVTPSPFAQKYKVE
ncbi:MAG: rod shape-determining protein [Clostridia bacterium]|nr:rod shape-determining protein [Clostridia bacterium]